MRKFFLPFLYLLFLTTLFSCKSLKNLVNNKFPPLSTTDQQYASVERNLATIDSLQPHVGAYVNKDLILEYLPAEIKKAVDSLKDSTVVIYKVEPEIAFDQQGIFVATDFHIGIPKQNVEIKGHFKGATAVSTRGDSLLLSSALNSLKISSIKFTKKRVIGRKAMAQILTSFLKNYLENINGEIFKKPVIVDIAWGKTYEFDIRKLFTGAGTEIEAVPVVLNRHTKQSSVRIDKEGITVMVELTKDNASIGSGAVAPVPPAYKKHTREELARIFKAFDQKYNQHWLTVFDTLNKEVAMTAAISKAEVAAIFNEALANPITVKQKLSLPRAEFNKKVEVKRGDIDCQAVRKPFSYPDFNGDRCDWNCMRTITIGVCPLCRRERVEDPVCAASRRACRLRVEAERVAWQAARETARIAHQARNEAAVAACNVVREATDFMALGRFKGEVSGSASGRLAIQNFRFSDDLSAITLDYSGRLDAKLVSDLEMQPVDLGHVFLCYTNYGKKTTSDINVAIPNGRLHLGLDAVREGQNLRLNAKISPIDYSATISPSPLHALLMDPKFALECPIFRTILGAGTIGAMAGNLLGIIKLAPEQELLLQGRVKGEYKLSEMGTSFKPIPFSINGGPERTSQIFWNHKSIQFTSFKQAALVAVH